VTYLDGFFPVRLRHDLGLDGLAAEILLFGMHRPQVVLADGLCLNSGLERLLAEVDLLSGPTADAILRCQPCIWMYIFETQYRPLSFSSVPSRCGQNTSSEIA